jgi:hypothetical protein
MKIHDLNLTGTSAAETGQAQKTKNLGRAGTDAAPARGVVDGSKDRVEFSGTMNQLARAVATFETTQASRVQALGVEYQSGKYKPNPAAISKGMVSEALSAGSQ